LVIYCPPKRVDGIYERVRDSLAQGGIEAFYAMLMRRDLTGFHTHSSPPMTVAKSELIDIGLKPAERFAKEWLSKELDLPLWPCDGKQLYRAFTRWCRVNGERIPPNQAIFSSLVTKYAGNRLDRKKTSPSPTEHGVPIHLWMPAGTGPVDGMRWFDFAQECVATFESNLTRYCSAAAEGGAT
jgi:putative DNA primase/helicase